MIKNRDFSLKLHGYKLVVLKRKALLSPGEQLAMRGDTFGCHDSGRGAIGI